MAKVELKTVGKILLDNNLELFIPDYQRGYRWRGGDSPENSQIVQLLDDIYEYVTNKEEYEFKDDSGNKIKFYCLQPIVVARKNDSSQKQKYFLVDGQQRLTTLWLIYRYWKIKNIEPYLKYGDVEKILQEEVFSQCCTLKYETSRNDEFLNKIHNAINKTACEISRTLDEFYLAEAYQTINRWCKSKNFEWQNSNDISQKILQLLELKSEGASASPSLQVIWYELDESEEKISDQIALFNRINRGKIPLTSAELIKAFLFGEFSSKNSMEESDDNEISELSRFEKEWEEIENTLADDMFWGFLCNSEYETRIEFLFELLIIKHYPSAKNEDFLAQKQNKSKPQRTFYLFKTVYENTFKTAYKAREEIFAYFQKLLKYYRSHELYHLIGYLVHIGKPLYEIVSTLEDALDYNNCVELLKQTVKEKVFGGHLANSPYNVSNWEKQVEEVRYERSDSEKKELLNKPLISKILLLFNIVTVIGNGLKLQEVEKKGTEKSANALYWFPFKQNRDISWDIEHICSQATENHLEEEDEKRQRIWCLTLLDYYYGSDLIDKELSDKDLLQELEKIKNNISADIEKYPDDASYDKDDWSRKGINRRRRQILKDILSFLLNEENKTSFKVILDAAEELEREGKTAPVAAQDLSNLTLLDAKTNRSYKDAPYPVKRARILKNDQNGIFIPPCTKNVFLKAYSKTLDDMLYWDPGTDGAAYKGEIINTLCTFFSNSNSGNN